MRLLKIIDLLITSASVLFIVWITASFIDVNAHNLSDCKYAKWNAFSIFVEYVNQDKEVSVRSPPRNTSRPVTQQMNKPKKNFLRDISAKVSEEDVMNLARIIHAENGSHPNDEALVLTGVVVLKRVKSKDFPNTILGVVSQEGQYSTWSDGKFFCKPSKRSLEISRRLLTTDLADKHPDNLVFQSMFPQGKSVYKELNHEYFCLA